VTWPLLDCLSDDERHAVLSVARRRRFAKGEVVFHEGDPGDTLHLLAKGFVAVRITTPRGDVATLSVLAPGSHFGEMALVSSAPRTATVVPLEAIETMTLRRSEFDALRAGHRGIDELLVTALVQEVHDLSRRLLDSLYLPADKRVVRQLVELFAVYAHGGRVEGAIPLTQDDIASIAGTTRSTVNRVLKALGATGAVTVRRRRIEVHDCAELERWAR
jgi:CRP-like cAMP-binding protein